MGDPQAPSGSTRYEDTPEAKRLHETQQNVNEVVDILHTNLQIAMERDGKLSDMDERTKNLEQGCAQFKEHTVKLRRKMWYQNLRMKFLIGLILALLFLLLIYLIFSDD